MLGKKTKVPTAPNYSALAQQDTANAKQAWQEGLQANRPNQVGPQGSLTWSKDPNGNWTQTVTENPIYSALRQSQVGGYQTAADKARTAIGNINTDNLDYSKAPAMPTVGGYNQQVIDTLRKLQAPSLERMRSNKEAQMAAMGLNLGSGQAWNTEQQNIGDQENRADLESILAGINQGNTEFGQGMQAHQQGVQDINQARAGDIATASALEGMSPAQGNPDFASFFNSGNYSPQSQMSAGEQQYQAAMDRAAAKNADANGWMNMLKSGLGAAGSYYGAPGVMSASKNWWQNWGA